MLGKLVIKYSNTENEGFTETPFYIDSKLPAHIANNDTEKADIIMDKINTAIYQMTSELTSNSYVNATITYEVPVNL